jgi:hypothetical protein
MCHRSFVSLCLLFVAATVTQLCESQAVPPLRYNEQPCIGYLQSNLKKINDGQIHGDVFIRCPKKLSQLTGSGDILSWAIDVDRLRLVLIRLSPADKEGAKLLIVDLRSGRVDKTAAVDVDTSNLIPTCGAVMLIDRVSGKMIDAVSGDAIEVPKGVEGIRCDDTKKIVATQGEPFVASRPLRMSGMKLGSDVSVFAVSPNGKYVAFIDEDQLCLFNSTTVVRSCLLGFERSGRLVVWDNGMILAASLTGQDCSSPEDKLHELRPCPAILSWYGAGRDQMIQFMATEPQIIPVKLEDVIGGFSFEKPRDHLPSR